MLHYQAIAQLYHNPIPYKLERVSLDSFEEDDKNVNSQFGILELDTQIKTIKRKIDSLVSMIVAGQRVETDFNFISGF